MNAKISVYNEDGNVIEVDYKTKQRILNEIITDFLQEYKKLNFIKKRILRNFLKTSDKIIVERFKDYGLVRIYDNKGNCEEIKSKAQNSVKEKFIIEIKNSDLLNELKKLNQ